MKSASLLHVPEHFKNSVAGIILMMATRVYGFLDPLPDVCS